MKLPVREFDAVVIGAGGAGMRAALQISQSGQTCALLSKVFPTRSHTVSAQGGITVALGNTHEDNWEWHMYDTVKGSDYIGDQDAIEYMCKTGPEAILELEHMGLPFSRLDDGRIYHRPFGGQSIIFGGEQAARTAAAADRTGHALLHTLYQQNLKNHTTIFSEWYALDLVKNQDGAVVGCTALCIETGEVVYFKARATVLATGGAGRIYQSTTNAHINTGDGGGMAIRAGVPVQDMEMWQLHPTGIAGAGVLVTEGCRGEGGILVNKNGYRYLQDYGMGPETPRGEPKNKYMELGPRDKVSQAFWHEWRKGNTISTPRGDVVYLDLRHLGEKKLHERLPFICELAKAYVGVDPVKEPIPVRPTAHYTMGGIETDQNCETRIKGLFAVGECSSVGLHGANRLGSNSLAELVVFGRLAGEQAMERASTAGNGNDAAINAQVAGVEQRLKDLVNQDGGENWAKIRDEMGQSMEEGCGIYRTPELMQKTIDKLAELQERFKRVRITDTSSVFNTDLLYTIELGHGLNVAECMAHSAMARKESRGAHQRLDEGCTERDAVNFLKHTLAFRDADGTTRLEYSDVKITTLPPAKRVYGGEADAADKAEAANKKEKANG